jgi:hypothetical protein
MDPAQLELRKKEASVVAMCGGLGQCALEAIAKITKTLRKADCPAHVAELIEDMHSNIDEMFKIVDDRMSDPAMLLETEEKYIKVQDILRERISALHDIYTHVYTDWHDNIQVDLDVYTTKVRKINTDVMKAITEVLALKVAPHS